MLTGVMFVDGCTPDHSSDGSVVCNVSAPATIVVLVPAVVSVIVWSDLLIGLGAHSGSCTGDEVFTFCARCLLVVGPLHDGTKFFFFFFYLGLEDSYDVTSKPSFSFR